MKHYVKQTLIYLFIFTILSCNIVNAKTLAYPSNKLNLKGENSFKVTLGMDSQSVSSKANKNAFKKRFQKGFSDIDSKQTSITLSFENDSEIIINDLNGTPFTSKGYLKIDGIVSSFTAKGNLVAISNKNNNIGLIGTLTGYLNGAETDNNSIIIDLHYLPHTKQCFISVSLGIAGNDDNIPLNLDFGKRSSNFNGYIQKISELKSTHSNISNETNNIDTNSSSIMPANTWPVTDFQVKLQSQKSVFGNSMTVYSYHPNKNDQGGLSVLYATVKCNTYNFENYMRKTYGYTVEDDTTETKTAYIRLASLNKYFLAQTPLPEAGTTKNTIIIPYYLNGSLSTYSYTYVVDSIKQTYYTNTGTSSNNQRNQVQWEFYKRAAFDWDDPLFNNGIAVNSTYLYSTAPNIMDTATICASGDTYLSCLISESGMWSYKSIRVNATAQSSMTIVNGK